LVKCPPEQAETTVKCPAIGVVLVLEFWLKLNLTSISRLKRTKNRPDSSSFCSTGHIVSYIYDSEAIFKLSKRRKIENS
jgi:hypothetical protein